jgi:hypothetical protein
LLVFRHCIKSQKGQQLIAEAAERTESASPGKFLSFSLVILIALNLDQHKFVPWLFFNNVSLANAQFLIRDLPITICDWIVGAKPDVCSGIGQGRVGGCNRPRNRRIL